VSDYRSRGEFPIAGMTLLILVGCALGLGYNAIGLEGRPAWGLPWKGVDRLAIFDDVDVVTLDAVELSIQAVLSDAPLAGSPLAGGSGSVLPQIVNPGRPVPVNADVLKAFVDHGSGALIVDARDADEYATSHIPGAINMPYDQAATDPALLDSLQTEGRPIITYCGGGSCELSIKLADELYYAGHERVAVYMGGFPEWTEAGYPVEAGRR